MIDNFGRYIVIRQQRIYRQFGNVEGCINEIYNANYSKIYEHDYYDGIADAGSPDS